MVRVEEHQGHTENEKIVMRPARKKDLRAIAALDREVYVEEGPWTLAQFRADFSADDRYYLVLLDGERIVGYGAAAIDEGVLGVISMLTVMPSHRGRGLGSKMLRELLRWLDEHVAESILQTRIDNPVQKTYERYGFVRTATLKQYYPNGADAIEMRRVLTK